MTIVAPIMSPAKETPALGGVLRALNMRIERDVERFKSSKIWDTITSQGTPTPIVVGLIREVYWEIHCYQPFTTKSGFQMIGGAKPTDMKLMRTLLLHKWDEVEHRVWAWDGYLAFGGDPTRDGKDRMSPGAFAVAAVWERLATTLDPLSYVGAEYLFEALTARLTPMVVDAVAHRGLSKEGMRFIADHAIEDQKHQNLFAQLITEIGGTYPELESEILYSYDCFNQVYPLPLWQGSLERAIATTQ